MDHAKPVANALARNSGAASAKPPSKREAASSQRRQAIFDAGLQVFAAHGFAAARLDEVAERAGVAKGTIYLSFKDKEDLFEQIVRSAAAPVLARLDGVASQTDLPLGALIEGIFHIFQTEVLGTYRQEIMRLVITEGGRFPRIAAFYHAEVVAKGLAIIRKVAARGRERGELDSDALIRFPHLVFAPLLMSVVWKGVFEPIDPLDVPGLLAAHRAVLMGQTP